MSDAASVGAELEGLATRLSERFAAGVDAPWPDFDALALEVFDLQFRGNVAFRGFCEGRGITPRTVSGWREVPLVPTTAFRHVDLVVGPPRAGSLVFETSGTTRGRSLRGRHHVPLPELYRASLLPPLRRWLLPAQDGGAGEGAGYAVVSLIPPSGAPARSSLSYMVSTLADATDAPWRWAVTADGAPDPAAFEAALDELGTDGPRPLLVLSTSFGLVHLLDRLEAAGRDLPLPRGSRLMETGGYKGRSRTVERPRLHEMLTGRLGLPARAVVGEYGMTELLSQMYEPVAEEGDGAVRRYVAPPWLAVRVLDPRTLAPVPEGEEGLVAFYDLANVGSVSAVLTEDVGRRQGDGLVLSGRVPGTEPRGCSLAVEELLAPEGAG